MIKTIIFDLGKVLIPFEFQNAYDRLTAITGLTADQMRDRLRVDSLVTRFESGQVEPLDFFAEVCRRLEVNLTYDQFQEIWSSIFLPDPLVPEPLIAALKQRYRLLLLSNTNEIHYQMLIARYPLLGHFNHHILSHRVGAMKPDPAIYRAALAHAHCEPAECFFTDDIPDYVEGARAMGIDAEVFRGLPQLESHLRARGVAW